MHKNLILLSCAFTAFFSTPAYSQTQFEQVIDEIRSRTTEITEEEGITRRAEFVNLTDADKATLARINLLASEETSTSSRFEFDLDWIKKLLAKYASVDNDTLYPFLFQQLDSILVQLAHRDPDAFLSFRGDLHGNYLSLFDESYKHANFPEEIRIQVVTRSLNRLEQSIRQNPAAYPSPAQTRIDHLLNLVNRTRLYSHGSLDSYSDHHTIFTILEQYTRKHLTNRQSYLFYAQILANRKQDLTAPKYADLEHWLFKSKASDSTKEFYRRLVESMKSQKIKADWIAKILDIAHTSSSFQLDLTTEGMAKINPYYQFTSERDRYIRGLGLFINQEYMEKNPCTFGMRFQVRWRRLVSAGS